MVRSKSGVKTSWGWWFIPLFTGFYTSQVVGLGILNHLQCFFWEVCIYVNTCMHQMHPIWMVIKCHLWLTAFACDFSHQLGTIYFGKWCCLPLRIQRRIILVNKSVFFLFQWLPTPSTKDTKTTKPFKQPPAIISNLINNLDSCDLLWMNMRNLSPTCKKKNWNHSGISMHTFHNIHVYIHIIIYAYIFLGGRPIQTCCFLLCLVLFLLLLASPEFFFLTERRAGRPPSAPEPR